MKLHFLQSNIMLHVFYKIDHCGGGVGGMALLSPAQLPHVKRCSLCRLLNINNNKNINVSNQFCQQSKSILFGYSKFRKISTIFKLTKQPGILIELLKNVKIKSSYSTLNPTLNVEHFCTLPQSPKCCTQNKLYIETHQR